MITLTIYKGQHVLPNEHVNLWITDGINNALISMVNLSQETIITTSNIQLDPKEFNPYKDGFKGINLQLAKLMDILKYNIKHQLILTQ